MIRRISAILLAVSGASAHAATWYVLKNTPTDSALFFFDVDTVVRQNDSVLLWIKEVRDLNAPPSDASYETAVKESFDCANHTTQWYTSIIYDKKQKTFIANPSSSDTQVIPPDSLGDAMMKVICTPDFPKNRSNALYSPVPKNDPVQYSVKTFDRRRLESAKSSPN